jgi:hypothetical protein
MSFVNNEGADAWELGDAIRIPVDLDGPEPDETTSDDGDDDSAD